MNFSKFHQNEALDGGSIFMKNCEENENKMTNCEFFDNKVKGTGGAIYLYLCDLDL